MNTLTVHNLGRDRSLSVDADLDALELHEMLDGGGGALYRATMPMRTPNTPSRTVPCVIEESPDGASVYLAEDELDLLAIAQDGGAAPDQGSTGTPETPEAPEQAAYGSTEQWILDNQTPLVIYNGGGDGQWLQGLRWDAAAVSGRQVNDDGSWVIRTRLTFDGTPMPPEGEDHVVTVAYHDGQYYLYLAADQFPSVRAGMTADTPSEAMWAEAFEAPMAQRWVYAEDGDDHLENVVLDRDTVSDVAVLPGGEGFGWSMTAAARFVDSSGGPLTDSSGSPLSPVHCEQLRLVRQPDRTWRVRLRSADWAVLTESVSAATV